MRFLLLTFVLSALANGLWAQKPTSKPATPSTPTPLEVCDLSITLNGKEPKELFYAFAAGDKLIFNFNEINGAMLSEVEISELPDNLKFKEQNTTQVKDKRLEVVQKGVYRFRFSSDVKKDRTVKVKIQRIPASDKTKSFVTAVRWVERFDTIYQSNDTKFEKQMVKQTRRVLARTDTALVSLVDKTERIHSRTNVNNNASSKVQVTLPANNYEKDRSYEVIAWSYWIGTGTEAGKQYSEANRVAGLAKSAVGAASKLGYLGGPYGALASLALDGVSFFITPKNGDNVKYKIMVKDKVLDQGDGISAFARQNIYTQGSVTFEFSNDNYIDALDVNVKMIAIALVKTYRQEEYLEEKMVPVARKFEVKVNKVPVAAQ
jgi:hypothetical protein